MWSDPVMRIAPTERFGPTASSAEAASAPASSRARAQKARFRMDRQSDVSEPNARPSCRICRAIPRMFPFKCGWPCLICRPWSRTEENPPYGILGRTLETSASFDARYAPPSSPTRASPGGSSDALTSDNVFGPVPVVNCFSEPDAGNCLTLRNPQSL